ncbi:DUF5359 family protein [Bacillus solimangrovi]|uniref:Uncharacterized protein n=1 Tax=Bacillus solimangrovi TaxID=1305675 RepID=A0A1E5LHF2_9BACI|nr:DUF5359 family protein [Bacillus solimangrovi]OEH93476.1 hypothetical protein BFG57_00325 [Bacillus solimangrovi]
MLKRIENTLIKLLVAHFVALLVGQWLILYSPFGAYFSRVIMYEGVGDVPEAPVFETIDSPTSLWYDEED